MGHQGVLSQWDDDRGFGFIVARDGAERYFVHISAFEGASRPQRGNRIDFAIGPGRDGKPSATRARVLGVVARPTPRRAIPDYFDRHAVRVWAACLLIALVFVALIFDRAPIWLAIAYALMGWISFVTYWWDKDSAKARGRRTRETTLHLFDLAFGIVGGLLAQQVLRHKTSKAGFIAMTIAIFAVHMLALLAFVLMPALSAFGR